MKRILVSLGLPLLFAVILSAACGPVQEAATAESVGETDTRPPRILVTNDDGYATEGIAAMAERLAEFADVVVVAPKENESGSSQSARLYWKEDGIRVYEVSIGEHLTGYAINGTPTDCVFLGLKIFGKEKPFDLVVSGINHGANIGIAYYYSGTVGAAFEALVNGIPAIAVSQSGSREDVEKTAEFAARVVRKVLAQPLDEGVLLSINVPKGELECVATVPPGDYPREVAVRPADKTNGHTITPVPGTLTGGDE